MWLLENFKWHRWLTFLTHVIFLGDDAFPNHCFPFIPSQHPIGLELSLVLGLLIRKFWEEKISPRSVCSHGKWTYICGGKRPCPVANSVDFMATTIGVHMVFSVLSEFSPSQQQEIIKRDWSFPQAHTERSKWPRLKATNSNVYKDQAGNINREASQVSSFNTDTLSLHIKHIGIFFTSPEK